MKSRRKSSDKGGSIDAPYQLALKVIDSNCLYCHQPYVPRPEHPHYCDNCVKQCDTCKVLKGIWAFPYDFDSTAYKYRKEHNQMKASVASTGPTCSPCLRALGYHPSNLSKKPMRQVPKDATFNLDPDNLAALRNLFGTPTKD